MRNPACIDPEVEAAIEETRIVLGMLSRFGLLRDGREDDPATQYGGRLGSS